MEINKLLLVNYRNNFFQQAESLPDHFEHEPIASDPSPLCWDKPLFQEARSYRIQVNFRPGNPTPIYVTIANVSHLTLTKENLFEIFRLANQYTINTPYPLGDSPMIYDGLVAYRPNHNGTHSARQVAYLDALFDLVENRGSQAARNAYASFSEDDLLNLRLAGYFLRAGRVDESSHLDNPIVDDYNTRSALIYEQYAKQLGVKPSTIDWIKKLIINSCKPRGARDFEMDRNPKYKFGFEALSFVHDLDLIRCYDSEKMESIISKMRRRLDYFISNNPYGAKKDQYLDQLMEYAKTVCAATGSHRIFDKVRGDRRRFVTCSAKGDYCWQIVKSINIPKWVR